MLYNLVVYFPLSEIIYFMANLGLHICYACYSASHQSVLLMQLYASHVYLYLFQHNFRPSRILVINLTLCYQNQYL